MSEKKLKEFAYALGNDLANAKTYLAHSRQFSDEDLPIFIKYLEEAYASGFSAGAREMRDICAKTVLNIYWDAKGSEERAEIWLADQICSLPLPAAKGENV